LIPSFLQRNEWGELVTTGKIDISGIILNRSSLIFTKEDGYEEFNKEDDIPANYERNNDTEP